jgi:hypothetical protein
MQMRDLALYAAGGLAIAASLVHGILGETKIFAQARIEPEWVRLLLRLVWQAGTVAWIGFGVLLIAAPSMASPSARSWIVATAAVVFGAGALGNAWATGGKHFGWMVLTIVVATAVAGR